MNDKLTPRYRVSYNVSPDKWTIGGEFTTMLEAEKKALEISEEFDVRIVKLDRTIIRQFKGKGKKVELFGLVLTSNGPKFITKYKKEAV